MALWEAHRDTWPSESALQAAPVRAERADGGPSPRQPGAPGAAALFSPGTWECNFLFIVEVELFSRLKSILFRASEGFWLTGWLRFDNQPFIITKCSNYKK